MLAGTQAMRSAKGAGRDSHRHDVAHIDCGVGVPHQHHIECVGVDLCDLGEIHNEVCAGSDDMSSIVSIC